MSANSYKEAIDIILGSETEDLKAIALEIAKSNPSLFVSAYKVTKGETKKSNTEIFEDRHGNFAFEQLSIKKHRFDTIISKYGNTEWIYEVILLLFPRNGPQRRIEAIKTYRGYKGVSLKGAKCFIDSICIEYGKY